MPEPGELVAQLEARLRPLELDAATAWWDAANFVQVGTTTPTTTAWPLLRDYVAHVHIKDAVAIDRTGLVPYP